ncbi:peptidase M4 [Rhodanobacter glycinis]|uniref:Peptidase M4 n=1 Tax=Rhodanobacter glycinis TaxID=582702 RepID=A0A502FMT6_9GAMM|nr:PepSY domain-containing protein [Rhodanobacter glycinis]TPG05886.1 peptidase M4 [Rhodanobacter glycinis]TPG50446.1 peptidase M4 [Rhodanobacter glycinis]
MIKRMLPLLIGLLVCGAAFAQDRPATAQSTTTRQTTTTMTRWAVQPPADGSTEEAVKTSIANAGYKEVKDLKFKDGVWRSKARGGNKQWVELAVGPVNGKVYPADAPSKLNKDEISAKLAAAGYQNIDDVKFDDGLWAAEAKTPHGDDVDLLVDPDDGSVVAKSRD